MTTVQEVYNEFVSVTGSERRLAISRKFLPFLRKQGLDRDFLLRKIFLDRKLLYDFDFTAEEFALLEPERYGSILHSSLSMNKFELAYAIGKATGTYGICCRFENETAPRTILEELNARLEGRNIATCFVQKADLKEMLRYGLIPCAYVSATYHLIGDGTYLQVLEYYKEGLTEEEIEY